jgi:hypothetical protein
MTESGLTPASRVSGFELVPLGSAALRLRGLGHVPISARHGEVPEWPIGAVSKTVVRASVPWVRIPPSPPGHSHNMLK